MKILWPWSPALPFPRTNVTDGLNKKKHVSSNLTGKRRSRFSHLFLLVFHCHFEPSERVPDAFLVAAFAEDGLDLLRASTQVHQLAGEVHALLDQAEVFVLHTRSTIDGCTGSGMTGGTPRKSRGNPGAAGIETGVAELPRRCK